MLVRGDVVEGQDIAADEKGVWCPPTSGSSDGYVMRRRWVELEVDAVNDDDQWRGGIEEGFVRSPSLSPQAANDLRTEHLDKGPGKTVIVAVQLAF